MNPKHAYGRFAPSYTCKSSTPPPHNFREVHKGAALAECLAVTGAWDEFDLLLSEQPHICHRDRAVVLRA